MLSADRRCDVFDGFIATSHLSTCDAAWQTCPCTGEKLRRTYFITWFAWRGAMTQAIVTEYGPEEMLRRLKPPGVGKAAVQKGNPQLFFVEPMECLPVSAVAKEKTGSTK
jgi:hypothetical protein